MPGGTILQFLALGQRQWIEPAGSPEWTCISASFPLGWQHGVAPSNVLDGPCRHGVGGVGLATPLFPYSAQHQLCGDSTGTLRGENEDSQALAQERVLLLLAERAVGRTPAPDHERGRT